MAFVQIASYETSTPEELDDARREWLEATEGVRAPHRRLLLRDRDVEGRFVEVILYDSIEDAMHNAMLPATEVLLTGAARNSEREVLITRLDVIASEL
jgi:hypothetical protein